MKYSARRPYYQLDDSQVQFFRKRVRFLNESVEKESVRERPYLEDDYCQMHLTPLPPSFNLDFPTLKPLPAPWIEDLSWDFKNSSALTPEPGQTVRMVVGGGKPPFSWKILDHTDSFEVVKKLTWDRTNHLRAGETVPLTEEATPIRIQVETLGG